MKKPRLRPKPNAHTRAHTHTHTHTQVADLRVESEKAKAEAKAKRDSKHLISQMHEAANASSSSGRRVCVWVGVCVLWVCVDVHAIRWVGD